MEITRIEFRECWAREVSDTEFSFGGKIVFEFTEGIRCARVEVECGKVTSKETTLDQARSMITAAARELLMKAADIPEERILRSIAKWDRYKPTDRDQNYISA